MILGILGGHEIIIILMLALLFFGAKKIPDLMKSAGKGMKEFKESTKEIKETIDDINPKNLI